MCKPATPSETSPCSLPSRPMSDLTPFERGVLRAIRQWCRAGSDCHAALPAIRATLRREGVPDSLLPPLFAFLATLSRNARPAPVVRCPDCAGVGADEDALLAVFEACRGGADADADRLLGRWLPAPVAGAARMAAAQVAAG